MSKQTAVEWLQECLSSHLTHEQQMQFEGLYQQALSMEKEQIVKAHTSAYLIGEDDISINDANSTSEKYYNKTYKTYLNNDTRRNKK